MPNAELCSLSPSSRNRKFIIQDVMLHRLLGKLIRCALIVFHYFCQFPCISVGCCAMVMIARQFVRCYQLICSSYPHLATLCDSNIALIDRVMHD